MSARNYRLSNVFRVALMGAALLAAGASSGSSQQSGSSAPAQQQYGSPAPRAMQPDRAIGLWKTSFGPVKIERDPGSQEANGIQGAWRYMQGRREVIGVFWGVLRGNVLEFNWHEPGLDGELRGRGYLVFEINGERFNGKWWSTNRDKSGDWSGRRPASATPAPAGSAAYGGDTDGSDGSDGAAYGGSQAEQPPY